MCPRVAFTNPVLNIDLTTSAERGNVDIQENHRTYSHESTRYVDDSKDSEEFRCGRVLLHGLANVKHCLSVVLRCFREADEVNVIGNQSLSILGIDEYRDLCDNVERNV